MYTAVVFVLTRSRQTKENIAHHMAEVHGSVGEVSSQGIQLRAIVVP